MVEEHLAGGEPASYLLQVRAERIVVAGQILDDPLPCGGLVHGAGGGVELGDEGFLGGAGGGGGTEERAATWVDWELGGVAWS